MIQVKFLPFLLLVCLSSFHNLLLADVNVLVIGSTHSFSEGGESGVVHEKPFNPTTVATHLQGILSNDPAITEPVNVQFEEIHKTKTQTIIYSGGNPQEFTSYCYSLAQHYLWPDGKAARLTKLRGQGANPVWDYIVLCNDPYITANFPGMVAEGVKLIKDEVAKSANPAQVVLLAQWPEDSSTFNAAQFNEIAYRVGNSAGVTVVPAGKSWNTYNQKDTNANHPTPRGEYLAAAAIYSKLYNRSAKTSVYDYPTVGDAIADHALSTVQANAGVAQYTGTYTSFNPFQMKYLAKRVVNYRETGTSTEDRLAQALDRLDDVQRISFSTSGYTGTPGTRWDFNYGRGNDWWEPEKQYEVNSTIYDWVYGFPMHHYDTASAPTTMPYGIDKHFSINYSQYEDGTDLGIAYNMVRPGTREPDWPEAVRAIPIRLMWQKMCEVSPGFNPLGDSTHMHPHLNDASAAFMYTLLSGRCPVVAEPTPQGSANPAWMQWLGHKTGYETAWQMSHLSTRAPGLRVLPSATAATTVTPTTTETMTVQFAYPPQANVTVTVSCSSPTAAIVSPKTLVFTPSNYNTPQQVKVAGIPGSTASPAFNVNFSTSSTDEIYNSLSDSWAYTNTRSATAGLTQVDNGSSQILVEQFTAKVINLGVAAANAGNTIFAGPHRGSITWQGNGVIQYTPTGNYTGTDQIVFAVTIGTTQTIGSVDISVEIPQGQVSVNATDAAASEQGPDNGTYVISRLGDTASALNVLFSLSGTATLGSDYTLSHTSPVTIPAGQNSVSLTLTPVDDSTFGEGAETTILNITPDAAYPIGAAAATITIADNDNNAPVVNAGIDQTITMNAGSPWSPSSISTQLWLDANDADTITLDGSAVTLWEDKSGNDRHASQNTVANQPAFTDAGLNGKDVLTFDGNSDFLNLGTGLDFLSGTSHSAFIVVANLATYSNIYGAATSNSGSGSLHVGFNGSTTYRMNYWGHDYGTAVTANFTNTGSILNYVWPVGSPKQILANGKVEGSGPNALAPTAMAGGGRISNVTGHGYIGGKIAEMVFLTGNVGQSDRETMEGYLAHKWGLTANLDTNHPYKTLTPGGSSALATLNASVTDADGQTPTTLWTKVTGPGTVTFANASAIDTTATFAVEGVYTLRLTANDGFGAVSDDIVITVSSGKAVTYDGNGGTGSVPVDASSPYSSGSTVTVLGNTGTLVRTAHTFNGWNTQADGLGTSYAPDATFTISSPTTLYAQWIANTYTVNFLPNGGTTPIPTNKQVTFGSTYGTLATTSRAGHTFDGWFTAPSGGTEVIDGTSVAITDIQTLYAQWILTSVSVVTNVSTSNVPEGATATFQVKLSAQPIGDTTVTVSRSSGDADISVQSAGSLTFTTSNWDTYQNVTLAAAMDADVSNGSSTITCTPSDPAYTTAQVTATEIDKETTLTVASGGNGTTSPSGALVVEKGVATAISATANGGCDFVNWTVTSGSATLGNANSAATTVTISGPATVQANFSIRQYTLTYSAGSGGTLGGVTPQTVNHGANGTQVTAVPNTGYSFVKWSDNVLTAARTDTAVTSNIAVTAEFSVNTYNVLFDANDGTTPDPTNKQVTFGSTYGNLATTSRVGHTFDGWFTEASGGNRVISGTAVTTASNHTLYARWIVGTSRIWADAYITSLDVTSPTTVFASLNFPSYLDGPLTGSSTFTQAGNFGSQLSLVNNGGNTFSGNITVNGGTLRIAGSPFAAVGSQTGFIAPSMTSTDTITMRTGGTLNIDDNALTGGYVANRFGTAGTGNRPAVSMTGGTLNLNGLNNVSSSVQSLGALTATSGYSIITINRSNGNPTLAFDSLAINKGSVLNFYSSILGTGSADARITFADTTEVLTNGIIAGAKYWSPGAAGAGEFATYGANGVTAFTAYDVTSNDINTGTSATTNFAMTVATTPATLTADRAVNSLNYKANGGIWSLGGFKLTLTSGMFLRNGTNSALTINNGTLTAGNGTDAADLHIFTAQQNMTIDALIANNSSSVVTLVKSHGNLLTVSGTANNTYTGGTYVVDGSLTIGNTANRTYLGTGKVTVEGSGNLTLGNVGATSNATGDDYTVINGGKINIASGTNGVYTANDTFNISANSIIAGGSASGQGLASLTRGTNITLASGAIVSHNSLSAALNTTTGTIQNLGSSADLYYGLNQDQSTAGGEITIGSGTAFKGISTDRSNKTWLLGTINIASGTTSVDFQSHATHGTVATLQLGNTAATVGAPVINFLGTGTVDINALGPFIINDTTAVYGDTSANQNVRFVATAGSTLTFTAATTGMGSGTGIASALVNNGGSLAIGNAAALNGAVTVEAGGRLLANQAAGLIGSGTLTFTEGSILEITNATGFSGAQATVASIAAGTIVRLTSSAQPGTAGEPLDSLLGSKSPIYQLNGDVDVPEPSSLTTTMTLNKNGSGVGGIVTNGLASAFFRNNANGQVTIGANGGVMAATTNTELQIQETIVGTGVTLTIGTTAIIDGAPKLGSVALGSAAGSNTYTGGTIINAGTLRQGYANVLGALTNQLTINGGILNMNGQALTVGNLTGIGGVIANGSTLTIGQGDNGGGNYQGLIQNSTALTKTGTGTITLSGSNSYTGATTINAGKLFINGNQTSATGNVTVAANATLGGSGTLGGNITVSAGGMLEFDISTAPGSHDKLELAAAKTLGFGANATLTINSAGGATTGDYTLLTAPGGIGTLPAFTLNLPSGWTATVSKVGNDLVLNVTSTGVVAEPFAVWAVGGVDFDADTNDDGVPNGLAFLLGAATPTSAVTLPTVSETGDALVLNFNMLKPANRGTATLSVQHSRDIGLADPWTTAPVTDSNSGPTNGVTFIVTPGAGTTNSVQAMIGSSEADGTNKLFGRLRAHRP